MKKSVKLLSLMMALLMVMSLGLTACGSKANESSEEQNPAAEYAGNYVCDRASIYIGVNDEDGSMNALVNWGSSVSESSIWSMSGTFDPETLQFEYHDCVRTDYVYDENGDI